MQQTAAQGGEAFKISFIVTFYNIPLDMLRQCVESILALSLQPEEREILLIDDGSPIDPSPVVADFAPSIRYHRQENQGPAVARNVGFDLAEGSHLQFVDADDRLLPKVYNACIDLVRRQREIDVLAFAYTHDRGGESRFVCTPPVTGPEYMLHNNLRGVNCIYLFHRQLLGDLRFRPGILHEDEEFVPQLLLKARCLVTTKACAYFYRRREGSIVNSGERAHLQKRMADTETVIDSLYQMAQSFPSPGREAMLRRVHQLTMDHLYNTMCLADTTDEVEETVDRLRTQGLFPLPDRRYTWKYTCFRLLTASRMGRNILFKLLS